MRVITRTVIVCASLLALGAWTSTSVEHRATPSHASFGAAQTPLDGILAKFGGDIVTTSDVRQARLLKLVETNAETDQAYVDAIINRRLMLSDLKRNPPAEPSSEAIDAKRQQWERRLGTGASVTDLLSRAGMSDAALRAWLRDDLRLEAYLDDRFGKA